jgi:hypothetical protein
MARSSNPYVLEWAGGEVRLTTREQAPRSAVIVAMDISPRFGPARMLIDSIKREKRWKQLIHPREVHAGDTLIS